MSLLSHANSLDLDEHAHYHTLVSRNFHFVEPGVQERLRELKILIAGCGSTGGACIEALARAGVRKFWLADNGSYELSNLNRQHARLESLGINKAEFHAGEIKSINPFASVTFSTEGISIHNVEEYVLAADLIFDAVDVTTPEGIRAKVLLHQKCHQFHKPVLCGLDLGYLQWGCSFDYRKGDIPVLNGKAERTLAARHPIAALFSIYPLGILPAHSLAMFIDLLEGKVDFASQMGCTSDSLSAIIVPAALKFAGTGELIDGWALDLSKYRYTRQERLTAWVKGFGQKRRLRKLVNSFLGPL